jgi:hypothetical protein
VRIWPASLSAKGLIQGNRGACGRAVGCIDKAGRIVPGLPFLIGAIKKNRLCTKKSLII